MKLKWKGITSGERGAVAYKFRLTEQRMVAKNLAAPADKAAERCARRPSNPQIPQFNHQIRRGQRKLPAARFGNGRRRDGGQIPRHPLRRDIKMRRHVRIRRYRRLRGLYIAPALAPRRRGGIFWTAPAGNFVLIGAAALPSGGMIHHPATRLLRLGRDQASAQRSRQPRHQQCRQQQSNQQSRNKTPRIHVQPDPHAPFFVFYAAKSSKVCPPRRDPRRNPIRQQEQKPWRGEHEKPRPGPDSPGR